MDEFFKEHFRTDAPPAPPAVELLTDPAVAAREWPEEVSKNPEFLRQVEERHALIERLDVVLRALPRADLSLRDAVRGGLLFEEQVAELYESLSNLLRPESEYRRALLYLPFEFLPEASWNPSSHALRGAAARFRDEYMGAWESLLRMRDVRANFVDGDLLEVEKRVGDLPRVVKAAHLIPVLVEKGYLTANDALELMDKTDDPILRQSIEDTLPALRGLGFLPADSKDAVRKPAAVRVESSQPVTADSVAAELRRAFDRVDAVSHPDATDKRAAWLRQEGKRKAVEAAGDSIRADIEAKTLDVLAFSAERIGVAAARAFVDGAQKAIVEAARMDAAKGKELFEFCRPALGPLWRRKQADLKGPLSTLFFHLRGAGVLSDDQLRSIGLALPSLSGPFSENLARMEPELAEVRRDVEATASDPELSRIAFPVALVFGSRVKGYGSERSDVDVAVFVKPGTPLSSRESVHRLLAQRFASDRIGEVMEFWTRPDGERLRVMDPELRDRVIGKSHWTAVLFGAAWEGSPEAIRDLRQRVLTPYFFDDRDRRFGRASRELHVEELEHDILQYRLMHRGYRAYYPEVGGLRVPDARSVDGDSAFWDSGYRQTATRLYASHVFLPNLTRE